MNKNFILYDSYTITFNDLKERSIVKQYYMLDENDQILKIIKRLMSEKNLTILSITHDIDEADMADNVIVLNDGKILAQASPTKIFSQTEMLRQIGLDIPFVDKLIYKLNQLGITIPKDVQTKDELKQYLCQLNSKK